MARWWGIFFLFFGLQIAVWWHGLAYKPRIEIVPNVPGKIAVDALAFGEKQGFFRLLGLHLQNFGDSFGRMSALKDYDFSRLERWMVLLDSLDRRSDYIAFLAGHYFSQTQNTQDLRFVINFLAHYSEGRLDEKWWWRTQAVYLAQHKLQDLPLALTLAKPLAYAKNVPLWVNQMPAFIHEKRGEFADALAIMEQVSNNADSLTQGELNFIRYFVKERLQALDSQILSPPPQPIKEPQHD